MLNQAIKSDAAPSEPAPSQPLPERSIDLVFLAQQSLGDKDLEIELLTLFEKQAETIVARLIKPVGCSDQRWQRDLAHTLKGSARAVGAAQVALRAEEYENAVAAGVGAEALALKAEALRDVVEAARKVILDFVAEQ